MSLAMFCRFGGLIFHFFHTPAFRTIFDPKSRSRNETATAFTCYEKILVITVFLVREANVTMIQDLKRAQSGLALNGRSKRIYESAVVVIFKCIIRYTLNAKHE